MARKSKTRPAEGVVAEAIDKFAESQSATEENRRNAEEDIRFSRLGDQWPLKIRKQREAEGRPVLTINRMPAFIRQVVNDSRQNKPAITVVPVDGGSDVDTAEVLGGLVRSIERGSNADVAYDTALEHAVSGGFGFFRIGMDYAHADSFDMEARIERIANPLSVHWDPSTTAFDASDWEYGFVSEWLTKSLFEQRYPGEEAVSFEGDTADRIQTETMLEDSVRLVEYFLRTLHKRKIVQLSDGKVVREDQLKAELPGLGMPLIEFLKLQGIEPRQSREADYYKVKRRVLSGMAVLEETDWPGEFIPICPVWGDEVVADGRRRFRSLIRDARDPQMMFNFWRALALDTPIPTPGGWTTMGKIKVGDRLFDETGNVCRVTGKSPVYTDKDCYRVEFTDGTSIFASGDHPWMVEDRVTRNADGFVWKSKKVTTEDLIPGDHFIEVAGALKTPRAELPVHPYVFGQWIGDGGAATGRITSNARDAGAIRTLIRGCGYECGPSHHQSGAETYVVYGMQAALRQMGVLGQKRIPAEYLRASVDQRWALLQGLMDSDGSYNPSNNACGFVTTDEGVAGAFGELLSSLGFKHTNIVRESRNGRAGGVAIVGRKAAWQFSFTAYERDPVFGLRRPFPAGDGHPRRTKRYGIKSVTPLDPIPVQCIGIDAPSRLFLVGLSMIPTHNSSSTELVALAPRAPFIAQMGSIPEGPEGQKWRTANTRSYPYLLYNAGNPAPVRQGFPQVPAANIQEALNASDDMKAIVGIYDSSLGAKSNETSGRAIVARQRESDTGTFHFIDNLARSLQYAGRVLLQVIPSIYTQRETIRILGEDMAPKVIRLAKEGQPAPQQGVDTPNDDKGARLYDLGVGKYDVVVKTGPSYSTQREQAVVQLTELLRSAPEAAPIIGDLLVSNMDIPGAQEIAKRLKKMLPPQLQEGADGRPAQPQIPPEMIEKGKQAIAENEQLKGEIQKKDIEAAATQAATERQGIAQDKALAIREIEIKRREAELSIKEAMANLKAAQVQAMQPPLVEAPSPA